MGRENHSDMPSFNPFTRLKSLLSLKVHQPTTQNLLGPNPFQIASSMSSNTNKGSMLSGVFDQGLAGKPIRKNWDFKAACELGYENSVWVYACVSVWMANVASIPWIVRKLDPKSNEWARIHNHPAEKFLKSPNPFMSCGDIMERLTSALQLGGNEIWKKNYVNGKLKEVWPVELDRIKPIPDRAKFIANYEITNGATKSILSTDEVVHFMLPNPRDIFWGLSPMKSIERVLACDAAALDWWVNGIYSGCRKDGLLSFKHDLTQEQFDGVVNNVRMQLLNIQGGRFPLILGHETEYTDYSMDPQELDYTQSRSQMRNEIIAAYHMPPPLVGDLDKSSYNNLTIARRIFWIDQVIPFLDRIKGVLNRSILPDFVKKSDLDSYILDYDISKVEALAEDFTVKLAQAQILFGMGVPLNVICKRLELDLMDIEGGDLGYVLNNYGPLGYINKNFVPVGSLEQLMELEMSERKKAIADPLPNPSVIPATVTEDSPSTAPTSPPKTPKQIIASLPPSKGKVAVKDSTKSYKPSPDLPIEQKENFDKLFDRVRVFTEEWDKELHSKDS